jgi:pimeloyl-ACP methyl ester carboxylesterase
MTTLLPDSQTFAYGEYRLSYEEYGTGERVLVWLHGLLLDANLSRDLARALAGRGQRVVLLDLLGHGRSDKPRHAAPHRMDLYARQVIALLDELGLARAVIGGVSLGANVSLEAAVLAPDRVQGLIIQMPVLEWAVPAAASFFIPLLLAARYARPLVAAVGAVARRLPRTPIEAINSVLQGASLAPDEIAAVLHGILLGPIAPTVEERHGITAPALVLGHRADLMHPFSDAANLVEQMPNARLVSSRSIVELWLRPDRLTAEFANFLDGAWDRGLAVGGAEPQV